jgi:hypothetical protein
MAIPVESHFSQGASPFCSNTLALSFDPDFSLLMAFLPLDQAVQVKPINPPFPPISLASWLRT